jgi:xanthine dehydrogenase molybdenum-binding subunit
MRSVGESVPRLDGTAKVCGRARYVDDYRVGDTLQAGVLRGTVANGLVKSIDTSRARACPGVEAVVTYADVPGHPFPTAGHPVHSDPALRDVADRRILTRRVRYWGDEIAAVVAVDELTAARALSLIEVEYEEYEPLLSVAAALAPGAREIHAGTGNIVGADGYDLGDLERAFGSADHVFTGEFQTPAAAHCALENHSALAYIDGDGRIVVVTSTQIPHLCRQLVGQALGIPWGRIRIIKPYVGGGFGGKQDVVVEPLAAFLTTVVNGRPVRVRLSREETFTGSRVRHAITFRLRTGVKKDGTIVAREMTALSNNGAYASHGHAVAANCGEKFRHLYRQEAIRFQATTVYTNLPAAGAMRGYGIPQVTFALESHLDDIAVALGLDPVAFRLQNLHGDGWVDPVSGHSAAVNGLPACLARGRELIRWEEKRADWRGQTGSVRRGLGVACCTYTAGIYPYGLETAAARIVLNQDGSVQLQTGAAEIGQGADTVLAQMTAETIGIPVDQVHVVSRQDTDVTPFDCGAYASRQTYVSGTAVRRAAAQIRTLVLARAAALTGRPASSLDVADGRVISVESGAQVLTLRDAAFDSYYNEATAAPVTAEVSSNVQSAALAYGCTFAAVEVDLSLGRVTVLEIYNVHDAGRIINPALAAGQVHGGVSMGLGYALYEELLFDPETGRPLNNNLLDYKLMTTMDTPEIGASFVETFERAGPFGNKALGEPPVFPVAPAIRNAIRDATGVRLGELPMNPRRLVAEFQAAGLIPERGQGICTI